MTNDQQSLIQTMHERNSGILSPFPWIMNDPATMHRDNFPLTPLSLAGGELLPSLKCEIPLNLQFSSLQSASVLPYALLTGYHPDAGTTRKSKKSTERGEGRAKLIAVLLKHHRYADASCLNMDPIGNNVLAKVAKVSPSTASTFFTKEFESHVKYRKICTDSAKLTASPKKLNCDFSPHNLYGREPPEKRRDGRRSQPGRDDD
ncbi:hypothetical protein BH11PLA2_BH11PLA2_07720 [soil metagenome]